MEASGRFCTRRQSNRLRTLRGLTLGALLTPPIITPALAGGDITNVGQPDVFAPFPLIDRDEMARLRGGFSIGGLEMEFGANVRTLIDNVVRLETIVQFTNNGIVSTSVDPQQITGGVPSASAGTLSNAAVQTAALIKDLVQGTIQGNSATVNQPNSLAVANAGNTQAVAGGGTQGRSATNLAGSLAAAGDLANRIKESLSSAGITTSTPEPPAVGGVQAPQIQARTDPAATAPTLSSSGSGGTQVDLSGLGDQIRGVVLNDTKGLTAAIQNITRNQITSTVINQANDRRIQVELNLQVDIKNFNQFSEALRSSLLNQRLSLQNHNL